MKIVIDIQDDVYRVLKEDIYPIPDTERLALVFKTLVKKGTPLPKGHGRLKDEDKIIRAIEDRVAFLKKNDEIFIRLRKDIDILGCIPKIRCEVPTIIEADKEESENWVNFAEDLIPIMNEAESEDI